jgi:SOS-response transcriptional repressor LexA
VLLPANERLSPMEFDPDEVSLYGKVVTVMRKL